MKSSALWTLSAMLLVALSMQATQAQQPPAFAALDKDKSGSITAEEAVVVPGLAARLTQLDVNADSKLSEEEYAALAAEEEKPNAPKQPKMPQ
ncbi:MAG: EF-hand domain-containing protein [Gammaproteobacteria bacterium]